MKLFIEETFYGKLRGRHILFVVFRSIASILFRAKHINWASFTLDLDHNELMRFTNVTISIEGEPR